MNATVEGKKVTLSASGWNISGVEDRTHKATDWYVYDNNVLVWSSLNNTTNLTSIIVPETIIELGHTYDVQVAFIGVDNIKSDKGYKQVPTIDYLSPTSYIWYSRTGNHRGVHFSPNVVAIHKYLGTNISGDIVRQIVKRFQVYTVTGGWRDYGPGVLSGIYKRLYGYYFRIVVKFTNGMIIDGSHRSPAPDQYDNLHGDFTFTEPHYPAPNELNGVPEFP